MTGRDNRIEVGSLVRVKKTGRLGIVVGIEYPWPGDDWHKGEYDSISIMMGGKVGLMGAVEVRLRMSVVKLQ
jgi:hypothetical protein